METAVLDNMTQEEKELLIKDLCGRLRYGVKAGSQASHLEINTIDGYFVDGDGKKMFHLSEPDFWQTVDYFQYYLRPMESMTEKETYIFRQDVLNEVEARCIHSFGSGKYSLAFTEANDWLNEHHFDYRGLIERGLALEAPEGMYKI